MKLFWVIFYCFSGTLLRQNIVKIVFANYLCAIFRELFYVRYIDEIGSLGYRISSL
jgi:hypothetical protein